MDIKNGLLYSTVIGVALSGFSIAALAGTQDIMFANNQAGIHVSSQDVDYGETYQGVLLDTENGKVPGFGLSASVMKNLWLGNDYLQVQYDHADGKTDYVGSYSGGTYGSLVAQSGAKLNDFSMRYGKGYVVSNSLMITPYGELGYHKWDRNVGDGIPGGYMEQYIHKYYGVGLMGQYSPVSKLVLTANAMIGHTFGTYFSADLPPPDAFSADLGTSVIYKAGIAADFAITRAVHVNMSADYTRWDYGASAVQPSGYFEPDSSTNITKLKAGLGYAF